MSSQSENAPVAVDLESCAREPIHIPGAIQPHGVLVAVSEPDLRCTQVSVNVGSLLNRSAAEAAGRIFADAFGQGLHDQIASALAQGDPTLVSPLTVKIDERHFSALLHRHDGVVIIELEPLASEETVDGSALLAPHHRRIQAGLAAMRTAPDFAALYPVIAQTIAALTGFDRVMVYRFDRDWHGEVVGEALASSEVDSYFGLHFPASDIPAQARALYEKSWLRLIPTSSYQPAALEPLLNPQTGRPLDLSFAALRSVSPIHLEYLRNMGVGASMSISLLVDGKLWGLVACHHRAPRFVSAAVRAACELFGQAASTEIAFKRDARRFTELAASQNVQTRFFDVISGAADVFSALVEYTPQLLAFLGATGAAVSVEGRYTLLGRTPDHAEVETLVRWLQEQDLNPLLATDCLESLLPAAAAWRDVASGLLAVQLSRVEKQYVLWFRPEVLTTVTWAGNPNKPVNAGERLHPRESFAAWQETVRGHSLPWTEAEQVGARELHLALNALVLRRAEGLLQLTQELERKNTDLNSFAYIAAHDLREPLRGIHNFSRFLQEDCASKIDADSLRKIATITSLCERIESLLEALLRYSRLGRIELNLEETPGDQLVDEVLENMATLLTEERVEVRRPRPLPVLRCDVVLMREVFGNLIANAVRYSPGPVKWVEIGWRAAEPGSGEDSPVLYVRDGGIGIRDKHFAEVFQVFRRLHGRDQFGGGTGIGLAIVKNVIDRHGGRIWIESEYGHGTTFFFTLG